MNQRNQQTGKRQLPVPFSPTRPSIQQILAWHGCKLKFAIKFMRENNQENLFVYIRVCVCDTNSVYISLCHIIFRDRQDREPAHASIPGDVEDHKDVRDQSCTLDSIKTHTSLFLKQSSIS